MHFLNFHESLILHYELENVAQLSDSRANFDQLHLRKKA